MREPSWRGLSEEELAELKSLEAGMRGLIRRGRRLVARLGGRSAAGRALVRNRLLCVLHDGFSPALRDLESIDAAARGRKKGPRR